MEQQPTHPEAAKQPLDQELNILRTSLANAVESGIMTRQEADDCEAAYLIAYWADPDYLWPL